MVSTNNQIKPLIFNLSFDAQKRELEALKLSDTKPIIHDKIYDQLKELVKTRNPQLLLSQEQIADLISSHIAEVPIHEYGVWVYYPWNNRLVHLLGEKEFIELRTNRNKYKITDDEQNTLSSKIIGIIGLSVGQSVALTLAMERSFGELRLADFDTLDLSNLNRIRTPIYNIGVKKVVLAAREIAEIDPFLNVVIFDEGIDESNIDEFFTSGGKLDLLIEECDGLDIKILSRYKARQHKIPVLMDTSDRGMLDIERFDLEPNRPILHGLIEDVDIAKLKGLSQEDKLQYLLPMVGIDKISPQMKASMIEVQNSISTWPQLASSVVMGGGVTAEMGRKILLGQSTISGRFYVDLDEIIPELIRELNSEPKLEIPKELSFAQVNAIVDSFTQKLSESTLSDTELEQILEAAIKAPTGGNCQPWKFAYRNSNLYLLHDIHFSYSLLDFDHLGSYFSFGAVIENIRIKADELGYEIVYRLFPNNEDKRLVATIGFNKSAKKLFTQELYQGINTRHTNRNQGKPQQLSTDLYEKFKESISTYKNSSLKIITDRALMTDLADVLSTAEMMLLMHPQGHEEIFKKELRWSEKEVSETMDGMDVETLGISKAEIIALKVASSYNAVSLLKNFGGGSAFKKMTKKAISSSMALGIISTDFYSDINFISCGMALERLWIEINNAKVSIQPVTQLVYLLARLNHGNGEGFDDNYKNTFKSLNDKFYKLLPELKNREPVFIFRIAQADAPKALSLRKPIEKVFAKS